MPFPSLLPKTDNRKGPGGQSIIWAERDGVPDNGVNVIPLPFLAAGIPPSQIDENWLDVRIDALGPSVTGATFVSLALDKSTISISFVQGGGDSARVRVKLEHTITS